VCCSLLKIVSVIIVVISDTLLPMYFLSFLVFFLFLFRIIASASERNGSKFHSIPFQPLRQTKSNHQQTRIDKTITCFLGRSRRFVASISAQFCRTSIHIGTFGTWNRCRSSSQWNRTFQHSVRYNCSLYVIGYKKL